MSEPDTLAYMTDDFALPRWNTQQSHDSLSSSAQAAQAAAQASSYIYSPGPPPQSVVPSNRLPAIQQQSPTGPSRQPRISQLLDEDQQYSMNSVPFSSGASLSRSASFGGVAGTARSRRHHMPDDLEGAFNADPASAQRLPTHSLSQHVQNSLYPPSVTYQPSTGSAVSNTSNTGTSSADVYQDTYFSPTPGAHPPKRSQTTHDASTSSRAPRSPHRSSNPTNPMLDPYSPQQNQYNPPSSAYPYSPTTEHRSFASAPYQSHSRTHSQAKGEPLTPPLPSYRTQLQPKAEPIDASLPPSNYSPASGMPASSVYSPSYTAHASSPAPSTSQNLAAVRQGRSSVSQPPTPLSYGTGAQPPGPPHSPYYGQDHQPMVVEPPPKRRASGLRRVRDQRDLRPYVNSQPAGRRMDGNGTYLSVSPRSFLHLFPELLQPKFCVFTC